MKVSHRRPLAWLAICGVLFTSLILPQSSPVALASDTPNPSSVTIAGNLQSELGCGGDWQPECSATHLTYDANDDVWQRAFTVPAGNWEYKAPLNNNWGENYGANAQRNGANIPLSLGAAASVKFYYDHKTHWITSNRNSAIVTAPGNFQSELGCGGDWDPSCLRSWLQDPDGDGTYRFETTALPAGNYETKITINESWDENYGQNGERNSANIGFNVPANNARVAFIYNATTRVLNIETSAPPPPAGDIQWGGLRHDTFDSYYRAPFGAVAAGTPVTLRFRTAHLDVDGVNVRIYQYDPATDSTTRLDDLAMSFFENRTEGGTQYDIWQTTLATPAAPAILYYKFRITDQSDEDFYSDAYVDDHDNLNQGGDGAASDTEPFPAFQLTVFDPAFETPSWLQNANVYQIFPDRFRNGDITNDYCRAGSTTGCPKIYGDNPLIARTIWNEAIYDPRQPGPYEHSYGSQYYGGDLKGIEDKLDYLQSIGIDTIYLNPIFKARSNHRYDTDNFLEVDPALGGDAALASLKREMERRGMHFILDGVFNHASSDSEYFDRFRRSETLGACESLASTYRSWFIFNNDNVPCNGNDYPGWFGFDGLPVFKDESPEVRDFFYRNQSDNVTKHWYERGASGWRFDVATDISHNWWRDYRTFAKTYNPDGALIGENFPDASQYLAGDQLDSVMNYRFRKNVLGFARGGANWSDNDNNGSNTIVALTPSGFDHALRAVREDYPEQATRAMLNLLDSHDTNRALYVLTLQGDNGLAEAKERLKLSALFQYTYLGAPMTYYGNEGALNSPALANGVNGPEDDPYNRAPYPWADESGDPSIYGPVDNSVVNFYATLARLRKQHPALRTGSFDTLLAGDTTPSNTDNDTYAFVRTSGADKVIVALNNGASTNTASVPVNNHFADGTTLYDALTGATYTVSGGAVNLTINRRGGIVLSTSAVDTTAPTVNITVDPAANADGWNNTTPVTVRLNASDDASSVREIRYWINDGAVTVATGATAEFAINDEGIFTVNARAIDNAGNASTLATQIVRVDRTAPALSCPATRTLAANADCLAAVPDFAAAATADDNLTPASSLRITQSISAGTLVGVGEHAITLTVTDLAGNTSECVTRFRVTDDAAPVISNITASPSVLSPANHKMINVSVGYDLSDDCGAVTSALSVTSNEPVNGDGDGDTASNWEILDAHNLRLRAERSGKGKGRIYTITITATDAAGNTSTRTTTVNVPRGK
jgi:glycosidase